MQFIAAIALLDNLEAETHGGSILTDPVIRMLQVVPQQLRVIELPQREVVEHVRSELMLRRQDQLQLAQELDLDLAAAALDICDLRDVS